MTTVAPIWPWGLTVALCGTVGLLVGSFLNVVVHRVPAGLSVVSPPSACPACDHVVRARDNVPVVSWLLLRGRCRDCAVPISWRYPLVEAATGAAFAATAWWVSEPVVLAPALVVVGAGIALALIDLEHGRLPFAITGVATGLVLLCLAVSALLGADLPGLGTVAISLACWVGVYGGLWLLTAGRGMGLGDVALAPLLALVLALVGVGASVAGLAAGFLIGMVVSVAVLVRQRSRTAGGTRVPHGPHMLLGAAVGLVAGEQLAAAYLSFVGLA